MQQYRNLSGNSGVLAFETTVDSITIEFRSGGIYLYNYVRPGQVHVEQMKSLAVAGKGLNTYINKYVREQFAYQLS